MRVKNPAFHDYRCLWGGGDSQKSQKIGYLRPFGNLHLKPLIGMIIGERPFQLPKQFDRDLHLKDPLEGKSGVHFRIRNCKHSIVRR